MPQDRSLRVLWGGRTEIHFTPLYGLLFGFKIHFIFIPDFSTKGSALMHDLKIGILNRVMLYGHGR